MNPQYVVVFVTVPSREVGLQIARELVERSLAACANVIGPATSIYRWEGAIQQEEEAMILIKTRADLFQDRLVPTILALHPYELPEIIALPIQMGLPAYLTWIDESTT